MCYGKNVIKYFQECERVKNSKLCDKLIKSDNVLISYLMKSMLCAFTLWRVFVVYDIILEKSQELVGMCQNILWCRVWLGLYCSISNSMFDLGFCVVIGHFGV